MAGVWTELGLCAQTDPEAFFPEKGDSPQPAKRVCHGCPVRSECLADALARDERFGVRGGLTPRERRRLHTTPGRREPAAGAAAGQSARATAAGVT